MEVIIRLLRWRLDLSLSPDEDDGPAMSVTTESEIAPGFQPPERYYDDEDRA